MKFSPREKPKRNKTYRSTHRKITFFSVFTDIFERDVRHHGFPLLNALNIRLTSSLANMEEQTEYSPGLESLALFKMSSQQGVCLVGKGIYSFQSMPGSGFKISLQLIAQKIIQEDTLKKKLSKVSFQNQKGFVDHLIEFSPFTIV